MKDMANFINLSMKHVTIVSNNLTRVVETG